MLVAEWALFEKQLFMNNKDTLHITSIGDNMDWFKFCIQNAMHVGLALIEI